MEEDTSGARLCEALGDVDASLGFLLLLTASILLSLWSVVIQRKGLCLTIQGEEETAAALPPVFPIKCRASAIVVGSLGFFLCLALKALGQAEEGSDPVALKSARTNVLASVLVLAAAVLRLDDLQFVERCQRALVREDILPN